MVLLGVGSLFVDVETKHLKLRQLDEKEAHAFLKFHRRVKRDDGKIHLTCILNEINLQIDEVTGEF